MSADAVRVPCECCDATGQRTLNRKEADTLGRVTAEWQTTTEILYGFRGRLAQSALIYRLNVLVAHGFVDRSKARFVLPGCRGLAWRIKP